MARIIDLSQPIAPDMPVYPGDDRTRIIQTRFLDQHYHNNHRVEISMHAGTHVDAPLHMTSDQQYISQLPLESFIGRGCLLDVRGRQTITATKELEQQIIPNSIVLLLTGFSVHYGSKKYYSQHPEVDTKFGELLVRKGVKMLGVDGPSPDRFPFAVHKQLLAANIYILENLTNLHLLVDTDFEVIALPLKLAADGSPVRAVAKIL